MSFYPYFKFTTDPYLMVNQTKFLEETKKLLEDLGDARYTEVARYVVYDKMSIKEAILKEQEIWEKKHKILEKKQEAQEKEKFFKENNFLVTSVGVLLDGSKYNEASELIVKDLKHKNKMYAIREDDKDELWIYREGIFVPHGKTYIREFCRKVLDIRYVSHITKRVIDKIVADNYVDKDWFFGHNYPEETTVQNGIVNIIDNQLLPFTDTKIFFNKLPLKYDPKAECFFIMKHFKNVLKNEADIPLIQEIFGYLLLKEYRFEKAFMFVGSGRNGKSKTLELMKRFLGAENCSNIHLQQFDEDNFSLWELFNKMANLCGDLDSRALKHTGYFKSLTGRDLISAPRKFKSRGQFVNYAKMLFATNELPQTMDMSPAFWNRWIVLEFPNIFLSEHEIDKTNKYHKLKDPDIIEKIISETELSGLFNFALEGLNRLIQNKKFSYSKSTEEIKNLWIRKSDSFSAFLMDRIDPYQDARIGKAELRTEYSHYCRLYKLRLLSDKHIKEILITMFGVGEERVYLDDKKVSFWTGISYKSAK